MKAHTCFIVFSLVLGILLFISYHCILLSVNLFCYLRADCPFSRYIIKTMGFTSHQHNITKTRFMVLKNA